MGSGFSCCKFAVHERPQCIWGWDLPEKNLDFLEAFSPDYFRYQTARLRGDLAGECRQHAAVALRTLYGQALETLFAMIGALLQAPDFVPGWLARYELKDLKGVAQAIDDCRPIRVKWQMDRATWQSIADRVYGSEPGVDADHQVSKKFARAWARLAHDLLDPNFWTEYNAIKHGMRASAGGTSLAATLQQHVYDDPPPEAFTWLEVSEFGSRFLLLKSLGRNKHNYVTREWFRNWHPENLADRLDMIALCLVNFRSFLLAFNRKESTLRLSLPREEDFFERPWSRHPLHSQGSGIELAIHEVGIKPLTREEILKVYDHPED